MNATSKIIICSTPIGNLKDASSRLIDSLRSADVIYSEDTRVTLKLLNNFGIKTPLKRLDENMMESHLNDVLDVVESGKVVCYCTDAGMPGVSDPGLRLVSAARKRNIDIEVLPGPSAAITAYVASGFTNNNFYFAGFLSKKLGERKAFLEKIKFLDAVIIIYESPNRIVSTLETISEVFPSSDVCVCRELTKIHEEVFLGCSKEVLNEFKNRDSIKGEVVICINSKEEKVSASEENIYALISFLKSKNMKTAEIAKAVSAAFSISKNEAYDLSLK